MIPENIIDQEVTVYDRYLFAVPVKGVVTAISITDGAYQVTFYENNPGGPNVTKHNGKYFHHQQCRVREENRSVTSESILDGADDRRTDPRYPMGYIPFAYHLVPLEGLAKVAAVMKAGEDRGNGWKEIPIEEHINHAISHIVAYLKGKHASHHLANAGCRILMALDLDKKEVLPSPLVSRPKSKPMTWPDWVEPEISDEVNLAHSIKEAFDRVAIGPKPGDERIVGESIGVGKDD